MDQGDYSSYYEYSQQSGSSHGSGTGSATPSSQASYPRSYTQYSQYPIGYEQQAYSNQQQYDQTWQQPSSYPAEEGSSRGATSHNRSLSHSPGPSNMTSSRRREQNRLAQRALRQRRETHVRELEDRVLHTSLETRHLASENHNLNQRLHHVALENDALRHEQIQSSRSARAWAQHHDAGAASYSPYASNLAGASSTPAQFYGHSPYSTTGTTRPASEPTPTGSDWPWDDVLDPSHLDPSFIWGGEEDDQDEEDNGRMRATGQAVEQWLDGRRGA